jgi:ParB family chromosome partitioning protein
MAEDSSRFDSRPRLGRGLAALIGDSKQSSSETDRAAATGKAPIEFLYPNSRNPRKSFDENELEELTSSIRHRGILQPILVRKIITSSGQYEIVAGERRWRAAQKAGLFEVPVLVLDINEREALEIAIIENVQRSDLNALDEARGYELLIAEHGYTQNEVSRIVGKSRSHIANTMRLLALPEKSKLFLSTGALSAGHARALLAVSDPDKIVDQILRDGLTVREIEKLGQGRIQKNNQKVVVPTVSSTDLKAWEDKLVLALGTNVKIRFSGESGEIRIAIRSLDQLDEFCLRLVTSENN